MTFAVADGWGLFRCFCHGLLKTVNEACVLSLWYFLGAEHRNPCRYLPLLPRVREKEWETAGLKQCSRKRHHKKKPSKTLVTNSNYYFEALLHTRRCTRYLTNIPHNSLGRMYYLVNAAGEGWTLASNPGLVGARVSVLSMLTHCCGVLK